MQFSKDTPLKQSTQFTDPTLKETNESNDLIQIEKDLNGSNPMRNSFNEDSLTVINQLNKTLIEYETLY